MEMLEICANFLHTTKLWINFVLNKAISFLVMLVSSVSIVKLKVHHNDILSFSAQSCVNVPDTANKITTALIFPVDVALLIF